MIVLYILACLMPTPDARVKVAFGLFFVNIAPPLGNKRKFLKPFDQLPL